jgi:hypothetical protein
MIEAFNGQHLAGFVPAKFAVPEAQTARGMGQLFQSTDISTWGIGEWAAVAIGGYVAIKLFADVKSVGKSVKRRASGASRSVKKTAATTSSSLGTVVLIAGLGVAAYFAYQYFQNSAAVPATTGATQ